MKDGGQRGEGDSGVSLQSEICNRKSEIAIRLGLRMIRGFSERDARAIEAVRRASRFRSLEDFSRRTGLGRAVIARLAEADAFGSLGRDRRAALWESLAQPRRAESLPLLDALADEDEPLVPLAPLTGQEEVFADYQSAGLSLRAHPLSFYRADLDELGITPAAQLGKLPGGRLVRVAGLVLLRQRPSTAKGITFVTLEDETGTANLVVHQRTWDRFYAVARRSPAWIAQGQLEVKDTVIHLVVRRLEDLSGRLRELKTRSRDFR